MPLKSLFPAFSGPWKGFKLQATTAATQRKSVWTAFEITHLQPGVHCCAQTFAQEVQDPGLNAQHRKRNLLPCLDLLSMRKLGDHQSVPQGGAWEMLIFIPEILKAF